MPFELGLLPIFAISVTVMGCVMYTLSLENVDEDSRKIVRVVTTNKLSIEISENLFRVPEEELSATLERTRWPGSSARDLKSRSITKEAFPNDVYLWTVSFYPDSIKQGDWSVKIFRGEDLVRELELKLRSKLLSPTGY